MSYAVGFLIAGATLAVAAALRLYGCRDCISRRVVPLPGKTDRASAWVSIGLLSFAALVFIAGGLHGFAR